MCEVDGAVWGRGGVVLGGIEGRLDVLSLPFRAHRGLSASLLSSVSLPLPSRLLSFFLSAIGFHLSLQPPNNSFVSASSELSSQPSVHTFDVDDDAVCSPAEKEKTNAALHRILTNPKAHAHTHGRRQAAKKEKRRRLPFHNPNPFFSLLAVDGSGHGGGHHHDRVVGGRRTII